MTAPVVGYLLDRYLQTSQTFVSNEVDEVRRQGVEVVVVALRHGDRQLPADPRVLVLADLPGRLDARLLLASHLRWAGRHPLRYVRFLLRVLSTRRDMGWHGELLAWQRLPLAADHLRSHGVGALHAHFAWWGATGALCLSPLLDVPWSMTLHAKDIFSKQRCLLVKLRRAHRVITVCDYNLRWMREHLALRRDVDLVVCGVEVPAAPWPVEGDADVVAVARLVEKKGLDVLVEAAALLVRTHPGLSVDIIGEGPQRVALEQRIEALGLTGRVSLLGARPHAEVLARIAGATLFCLPARIAQDGDRDSMPVVIKEAMARRVPIVASDVVAVPEMLSGDCGVLVPSDDPAALAEALDALLDDPQRRAVLAAAGLQRVQERFTLQGEVAKLVSGWR